MPLKLQDVFNTIKNPKRNIVSQYKPLDYSTAPVVIPDDPLTPKPLGGIPEDWDYKGRLGPDGQEIPNGAVGWTPLGDAYYGDGLTGWLKKLGAKFTDNDRPSSKEALDEAKQRSFEMTQAVENYEWGNIFKSAGAALGALGRAAVGGKEIDEDDDGKADRVGPTPITYIGRTIDVGATALFDVLQAVTNQFEAVTFGGVQAAREIAEESRLPSLGPEDAPEELARRAEERFALEEDDTHFQEIAKQAGQWFAGMVRDSPIGVSNLWDLVRAIEAPVEDKWSIVERNVAAGRIAYSSWIDNALKDEYIRRFEAGESPYLLELELQNPIAELAGELIFDPLNVIAYFGKIKAASNAIDLHHGQMVVQSSTDMGRALLGGLDAVGGTSAAGRMDDIVKAKLAMNATETSRIQGLQHGTSGLFSRSAISNQHKLAEVVSSVVGPLGTQVTKVVDGKTVLDADKMHEAMRAMMLLASHDPKDIELGVAIVKGTGISPQIMFSEAAGTTGRVLRETMDAAGGLDKVISGIRSSDDIADLVKKTGNIVARSTAEIFPTLKARAAAIKKVKSGAEVTEDVARLANSPLSIGERVLFTAEKFKKSSPIRVIDTFFANVYMGFSPGFYARNVNNNYFTALVDGGWKTIVRSEKSALETINSLAGLIPDFARQGIGAAGVEGVAFLKASQVTEKAMSAKIVAQSMLDTFNSMIPKAMDDIAKNLDIGTDMRGRIMAIWEANGYDVNRTMNAYKASVSDEVFDVYRNFTWVDDSVKEGLKKYGDGVYESIQAELRTVESIEDIPAVFKKYVNDATELADRAKDSASGVPYYTTEDVAVQGAGAITGDLNNLVLSSKAANQNVEMKMRQFISGIVVKASATTDVRPAYTRALNKINAGLVENGIDAIDLSKVTPETVSTVFAEAVRAFEQARPFAADADFIGRRKLKELVTHEDIIGFWNQKIKPTIGLDAPPIADISVSEARKLARDTWWSQVYFPETRKHFAASRDLNVDAGLILANEMVAEAPEAVASFLNVLEEAGQQLKVAIEFDTSIGYAGDVRNIGKVGADNFTQLTQLATINGIPTIAKGGAKLDATMLKIVNENLAEGVTKFKNLPDVPIQTADDALRTWAKGKGRKFVALPDVGEDVATWSKIDDVKPLDGTLHYASAQTIDNAQKQRAVNEAFFKDLKAMEEGAIKNFNRVEPFTGDLSEFQSMNAGLSNALENKLLEIRLTSGRVAKAKRDFALLDYSDRRNFDTLLATIYPFHYWHSRTYPNWIKRIASNPNVASRYANYRGMLEEIHADQPDWWKYNINSNELLGLDSDNPLYFNLESTLNPLNGILGVDFNDPARRTGVWTSLLDDLGKLGPSTWTPFSIITAMALSAQGEEEAAARWGGRLFPQTQSITAGLSLLEDGGNIAGWEFDGIGETGILDYFLDHSNLDPNVSIFAGGIDPYTRNRIGRALAAMENEGYVLDGELVTPEEFIEAARTQTGDLWTAAHKRAVNERAPGQLASFAAGVGFKGRTQSDVEIDTFYRDYYRFIKNQGNFSPEEVRQGYDSLRQQYPYMDTLLLARKGGVERDRSYSYSVLGRIPPGDNDLSKIAGLDSRLMDKFYEDKGYMEDWKEDERLRFLSSVLTLGSILEIPSNGTKQEWTAARNEMSLLRDTMEKMFGEGIHEEIDLFFQQDDDARDEFLVGHPAVEQALDWKAGQIANTPESYAATYYGGIDQIEKYYKGLMYNQIDKDVPNASDLWDAYWAIPDKKKRSAFWKANSGLQTYIDIRDKWDGFILEQMDELGSRLQEGEPVQLRDTDDASIFAEDVQEFVETPPTVSEQEIMISALRTGGDALIENIDLWQSRGSMSATTQAALEAVAESLGISFSELLETLR